MIKTTYTDYIDNEKEHLAKYITSSEKNLNDFASFLSEIYNSGLLFHKTINKKLLSFFDISKISDVTTKIDQNMKFFYQTSLLFLNTISASLEKLNLIILTPLKEFQKNYENENKKIQKEIDKICEKFKKEKQKLIAYQKRYYLSAYNYNENKKESYTRKLNDEFKEQDQQNLNLINSKYINDKQLYKYQLDNANYMYESLNQSYSEYYKNFELNEGGKLEFLNNIFYMYSNNVHDLSKALNEYSTQISSKFSGWKLEDDKKIIKNDFNYIIRSTNTPNKRFNSDTFLEYNNTNIEYVNNFYDKLDHKKLSKLGGLYFISKDNDDTISTSPDILTEEYQNNIMNKFFENLDSQNEVEINIITAINELIISDKNFPITFIKKYLKRHKESYVRMLNEKNINYFSNILVTLLLTNNLDKNNKDNLSLSIIYIGQKIYYILPKTDHQKIFICGLCNNIPLFKSENFWNDIIILKLKSKLESTVKDIEIELQKLKEPRKRGSLIRFNTNLLLRYNTPAPSKNNGGIFFDDMNANTQYNSSQRNLKKKKNKDSSGTNLNYQFANLISYENKFSEFTPELKKKFINKSVEIFNSVILEFIPAFINFNFGVNNSIVFLVNICNFYSVSNEYINLYSIYLNNCSYSIKQFTKNTHYDLKNKIEDIKINFKESQLQKNKNINNSISANKETLNNKEIMIIIKNVSHFLTNEEKINIFRLNKKLNSKINKKIYGEMLNFTDKKLGIMQNLKMHISIWKILLKYEEIKKNYPYQENLEKAQKITYDPCGNSDFCIIDLDCLRTMFINELETNRKKLNNILKTTVLLNPDSNYCQGMNFVGAFILKICEDEEESFYLLMGLYKNSPYRNLFINDLKDLKLYFNIFDRLLFIFIPTLYSLFNTNKILPNYYLSSWFITLFTGLVNSDLNLGSFVKIFDNFIISGWKSIFNVSMEILRDNEEILMKMKNETLVHYLTSKLGNEFLFSNEIHHSLIEKRSKNKISRELLHNIENQLNQMELMNSNKDKQ